MRLFRKKRPWNPVFDRSGNFQAEFSVELRWSEANCVDLDHAIERANHTLDELVVDRYIYNGPIVVQSWINE